MNVSHFTRANAATKNCKREGGYQNDLLLVISNKDKFFIPYSTSHVGDILSSYSGGDIEQEKRNCFLVYTFTKKPKF